MLDILRTFAKNLQAMKRTLLLFVVLVLGVSGLRAQHFEWAKGYSSSQEGNQIIGSVTDSAGNLYILGQFRNTAAWDGGSHLLPIAPYGPVTDVSNVLIAKITTDGEMAWKKVIHANNGSQSLALDIKPVGDTAFACLVSFELPAESSNYLYYLDTLLPTTSDYPIPHGPMTYLRRLTLIIFDFDGHVLEQHFLTMTYLDYNGNDIMREYYPDRYMNAVSIWKVSFDIDAEGNVYICRVADDFVADIVGRYYPDNGTISAIKYWVDNRVVGQSEVRNNPQRWYPQLLKFSPHMDSLLDSRYLVQQCDSGEYSVYNLYMKLDQSGCPYVVGTLSSSNNYDNTLIIDSVRNVSISHTTANHKIPYVLRFNTVLTNNWCIKLEDSVIRPEVSVSNNIFHDISFDYDSNLLFVSASTGRSSSFSDTSNFYSILKCCGMPLTKLRNEGFFIAFKVEGDSVKFHSYGGVPSIIYSDLISNAYGNLTTVSNRIFIQPQYTGGIRLPRQTIQFSNWGETSMGFLIFDYTGNLINGEHYATVLSSNKPGPISLHDSVLYLINYLASDATFGDIYVPAQGYNACIAKYVDTAFMTPYVPPTVHIGQAEDIPLRLYPNPAHGAVRIDTGGEPVRSAALLTVYGQRTPLQVDGDLVDLTGCPAGVYLLEITTHNNKYHQKIIIL